MAVILITKASSKAVQQTQTEAAPKAKRCNVIQPVMSLWGRQANKVISSVGPE